MSEKSNASNYKDGDRWKVKAIPFPPSAERRTTGKWPPAPRVRPERRGVMLGAGSLYAGFQEYHPGVLHPRSGGSSPTTPQPSQGGWKFK